jgi:hypothetical protein
MIFPYTSLTMSTALLNSANYNPVNDDKIGVLLTLNSYTMFVV